MQNTTLIAGIVLMILGVALIITAVFHALNHSWGFGLYELWLLPAVGLTLILLGRWLIQ